MAVYRLPFPSEGPASSWKVANGNWDQTPGHGAPQGVATDGQAYAADILHGIGGKLLAARAGVVLDLGNDVPDHTNPPGKGAGNWIWIRHGDGTIGVYLHLKKDSLRVTKGQWVPQGFWIASSGDTGNTVPQPTPHLHFEVHTYGESGDKLNYPDLGTALLVHFESVSSSSFRLAPGDSVGLLSDNAEGDYRQDHWRYCMKCHGLYFAGNPGSVCPAGSGGHVTEGGNYTLSVNALSPVGQTNWRYCKNCKGLFFGASIKRLPGEPGRPRPHGQWQLRAAGERPDGCRPEWLAMVQELWRSVLQDVGIYMPGGRRALRERQRRLPYSSHGGRLAARLARVR